MGDRSLHYIIHNSFGPLDPPPQTAQDQIYRFLPAEGLITNIILNENNCWTERTLQSVVSQSVSLGQTACLNDYWLTRLWSNSDSDWRLVLQLQWTINIVIITLLLSMQTCNIFRRRLNHYSMLHLLEAFLKCKKKSRGSYTAVFMSFRWFKIFTSHWHTYLHLWRVDNRVHFIIKC